MSNIGAVMSLACLTNVGVGVQQQLVGGTPVTTVITKPIVISAAQGIGSEVPYERNMRDMDSFVCDYFQERVPTKLRVEDREGAVVFETDRFFLQGVNYTLQEASQIVTSNMEDYVVFHGRSTPVYNFNLIVPNGKETMWFKEFEVAYNNTLRGSQTTARNQVLAFEYEDVIIYGHILRASFNTGASTPRASSINISYFAPRKKFKNIASDAYASSDLPPAGDIVDVAAALRVNVEDVAKIRKEIAAAARRTPPLSPSILALPASTTEAAFIINTKNTVNDTGLSIVYANNTEFNSYKFDDQITLRVATNAKAKEIHETLVKAMGHTRYGVYQKEGLTEPNLYQKMVAWRASPAEKDKDPKVFNVRIVTNEDAPSYVGHAFVTASREQSAVGTPIPRLTTIKDDISVKNRHNEQVQNLVTQKLARVFVSKTPEEAACLLSRTVGINLNLW